MCTDFSYDGHVSMDGSAIMDDFGYLVAVPGYAYKVADTNGWYGGSGFGWNKLKVSSIFAYDLTWTYEENVL